MITRASASIVFIALAFVLTTGTTPTLGQEPLRNGSHQK